MPFSAVLDQLLQGGEGVAADVERPVAGDRQRLGRLDEPSHQGHVDVALAGQAAEHHAVYAQLLAELDVEQHRLHLGLGVEEVASPRADNHVDVDRRGQGLSRLDLAIAGGRASFGDAGAQFHAAGPTHLGLYAALCGVGANLDNTFHRRIVMSVMVNNEAKIAQEVRSAAFLGRKKRPAGGFSLRPLIDALSRYA